MPERKKSGRRSSEGEGDSALRSLKHALVRALGDEAPAEAARAPPSRRSRGLATVLGPLAGVAVGVALAHSSTVQEAVKGWAMDRYEDLLVPMPPEQRHRLRRLRHWRAQLPPDVRQGWVNSGQLGPELRALQPVGGYNRQLEQELVEGPAGGWGDRRELQALELIWVQDVQGRWHLVPASLDPANTEGLLLNAALAHELGFGEGIAGAGAPFEDWQRVPGGLAFSIAGREFREAVKVLPPATPAQLQEAAQGGPAALAALARGQRMAVVPGRTIQALQQAGLVVRLGQTQEEAAH